MVTGAARPAHAPDPVLEPLLELCGPGDSALHEAASKLLTPALENLDLDPSVVTFAVRTSGSPYVRPRGLRLERHGFDLALLEEPVRGWLKELGPSALRRCGIAMLAESDGEYRVSLVSADAPARIAPLPSQVSTGERLSFRAVLRVPTSYAELVVLGPRGTPRTLAAALDGREVSADFYLDGQGVHRLQLMVDAEGGPEAAAEAWVAVGTRLPSEPLVEPVPGERAARPGQTPEAQLTAMLNAARLSEGMPRLTRDLRLDRLAQQHARAMQLAGRLAHDLGDGNPLWRAQAANVASMATGENVARAPTLARAHRAIWESPSHRANLLGHFDAVGIGVRRDPLGEWWVCELLVDQR